MDIELIKKVFDDYAHLYDMNSDKVYYKYKHSYRTMDECAFLARELCLNEEETFIAKTIGLFHDIGRFNQAKRFDSFDDYHTIDHADESARVLFEECLIDKCNIDKKYYRIIEKAIKNHNKMIVEDGLTQKELFFCKIIRDADKLDILYGFTNVRTFSIKDDDSYISDIVRNSIYHNKQVPSKDVTNNERLLIFLGFAFNIYFDVALKKIRDSKYYELLYNDIKNKEKFQEYFDITNKYIEERLKNK